MNFTCLLQGCLASTWETWLFICQHHNTDRIDRKYLTSNHTLDLSYYAETFVQRNNNCTVRFDSNNIWSEAILRTRTWQSSTHWGRNDRLSCGGWAIVHHHPVTVARYAFNATDATWSCIHPPPHHLHDIRLHRTIESI